MRAGVIKEARVTPAGGSALTIAGNLLKSGTSIEPDMPGEEMSDGSQMAAGKRHNISLVVAEADKVAAFTEVFFAAAGTASDPTTTPLDWTTAGRMESEGGAVNYTAGSREDAGRLPIFRNMALEVLFDLLAISNKSVVDGYSEQECAVSLKRVDGTYKQFQNVKLSRVGSYNPGVEEFQTVRVRLSAGARDITTHSLNIASSLFATLNTAQLAGNTLKVEVDYYDDSGGVNTVTFDPTGFTVTPLEPFGQESLEGIQLNATGYGPTEGSFVTLSPVL